MIGNEIQPFRNSTILEKINLNYNYVVTQKKVSITDSIFIVIEIFTDFHARGSIYLFLVSEKKFAENVTGIAWCFLGFSTENENNTAAFNVTFSKINVDSTNYAKWIQSLQKLSF